MSGRVKVTQLSAANATQPWVYPLMLTSLLALTAVVTVFVFLGLQVQRNKQVSASNSQLRAEITQLETNVSAASQTATASFASLQSQIDILRSQQAELQMDSGNITILQTGTFIWGVSAGNTGIVSYTCIWMWVGWQITTPGTGYVVGQLITLNDPSLPGIILNPPVFRVATVDGSGGVLTFTILTVGCARIQNIVPRGPFEALTVNGTGLTMTASSSTNVLPPFNSYYAYPTPAQYNTVALQESRYYLKQLTVSGVSFTILQLDAPPTVMDLAAPTGIGLQTDILMTNYAFEPPLPVLLSLDGTTYPFTNRNLNAINLADTTNCYVDGVCFFSPYWTTANEIPNAVTFKAIAHYGGANTDDYFYPWIAWYWASIGGAFNYLAPGMTFSLHQPLMLVLPSL